MNPPGTRPHGSHDADNEDKRPKGPCSEHKSWHTRGYLPHFDASQTYQSITYRLIDSLPAAVLVDYQRQADREPDDQRQAHLRRLIERYLDAGHGSCVLRQADAAQLVIDSWKALDGEHYDLRCWVVMPNHVHVLIKQHEGHPLHAIITRWKSQSARLINRMLQRSGPLWMADYWDRYIRDESHYLRVIDYIRKNPVKAGLVQSPEGWPWLDKERDPMGRMHKEHQS